MVTAAAGSRTSPAVARHHRTAKLVILATAVIPEVDETEYRAVAAAAPPSTRPGRSSADSDASGGVRPPR